LLGSAGTPTDPRARPSQVFPLRILTSVYKDGYNFNIEPSQGGFLTARAAMNTLCSVPGATMQAIPYAWLCLCLLRLLDWPGTTGQQEKGIRPASKQHPADDEGASTTTANMQRTCNEPASNFSDNRGQ